MRPLLQRSDDRVFDLLVHPAAEPWAATLPGRPTIHCTAASHYSLREQWEIPRFLHRVHADLLFAPHFNVPMMSGIPFVCTIHDLILHRYPNQSSPLKRFAYRVVMRHAVSYARQIIAVSAFTAAELQSVYGPLIASRVNVIGEGVDSGFVPRRTDEQEHVLAQYGIRKPFFLYVGNAKEHKNVPFLLDAFTAAALPDTTLLLVAGGREAQGLSLPANVQLLPAVPDEHLPVLYSAATALVTATLYEGYGLPIVEAAACGCPIIASRVGALPEVAPPTARLLPLVESSFVEAFRSPPPRTSTAVIGRWDTVSASVLAVLDRALMDG